MARALGSYPGCRWFKSYSRYHFSKYGPVVKRSRHRPFTAVTRVRFSSGSPKIGKQIMLADFFCPPISFLSANLFYVCQSLLCLPISFNSKKISVFEQRKDKSVKFTEKKRRQVRRIRTPKTRRFLHGCVDKKETGKCGCSRLARSGKCVLSNAAI